MPVRAWACSDMMRGSCGHAEGVELVGEAIDRDGVDRGVGGHDLRRSPWPRGRPRGRPRRPRRAGRAPRAAAATKRTTTASASAPSAGRQAREEAQQPLAERRELGAQRAAVALVQHQRLQPLGPRDDLGPVGEALGVGLRERVVSRGGERLDRGVVDLVESCACSSGGSRGARSENGAGSCPARSPASQRPILRAVQRVFSHSSLSSFETCPKKYQLRYVLKVPVETEGIEAFVGKRVHEVLERLYQFAARGMVPSLARVIARFRSNWEEQYDAERLRIVRERAAPRGLPARRASAASRTPTAASTPSTTRPSASSARSQFPLDADGRYAGARRDRPAGARARRRPRDPRLQDRAPRARPRTELDRDRQLALYEIGVRAALREEGEVRLVWHYLLPNVVRTSRRTPEQLDGAPRGDRARVIDRIRAETAWERAPGQALPPGASTGRSARRSPAPPAAERRRSSRPTSSPHERREHRPVSPGHLVTSGHGPPHRAHPDLEGQLHLPPPLRGDRRSGRRRRARGRAGGEARRRPRRARRARSSRPTTTPTTRWRTRSSRSATARRSTATPRTAAACPASRTASRRATASRSAATWRASSSSPPTRAATSPTSSTAARAVFCGDTLFAAGCGRLFEGTPEMMFEAMRQARRAARRHARLLRPRVHREQPALRRPRRAGQRRGEARPRARARACARRPRPTGTTRRRTR